MLKISIHIRERVINNFINGKNQSFIARKFKVSRGSVQKSMKKHLKGEGVLNLPKIGRPQKLSLRTQRKIVIKSKANPFSSSNELKSECNLASEVSSRTIRRILLKNDLYGRIARKNRY